MTSEDDCKSLLAQCPSLAEEGHGGGVVNREFGIVLKYDGNGGSGSIYWPAHSNVVVVVVAKSGRHCQEYRLV